MQKDLYTGNCRPRPDNCKSCRRQCLQNQPAEAFRVFAQSAKNSPQLPARARHWRFYSDSNENSKGKPVAEKSPIERCWEWEQAQVCRLYQALDEEFLQRRGRLVQRDESSQNGWNTVWRPPQHAPRRRLFWHALGWSLPLVDRTNVHLWCAAR